jgi:hypothetical protein
MARNHHRGEQQGRPKKGQNTNSLQEPQKKRREIVLLVVNCLLKVVFQIVGEFSQFFNLKVMMLTNKMEFYEKKGPNVSDFES